jgi:hypothetical protein
MRLQKLTNTWGNNSNFEGAVGGVLCYVDSLNTNVAARNTSKWVWSRDHKPGKRSHTLVVSTLILSFLGKRGSELSDVALREGIFNWTMILACGDSIGTRCSGGVRVLRNGSDPKKSLARE